MHFDRCLRSARIIQDITFLRSCRPFVPSIVGCERKTLNDQFNSRRESQGTICLFLALWITVYMTGCMEQTARNMQLLVIIERGKTLTYRLM